jgi:hypothetical protein
VNGLKCMPMLVNPVGNTALYAPNRCHTFATTAFQASLALRTCMSKCMSPEQVQLTRRKWGMQQHPHMICAAVLGGTCKPNICRATEHCSPLHVVVNSSSWTGKV